jgi:2-iminobutanoate/2-iminopropanoate deaminase
MERTQVTTADAPAAIGPYSQAIVVALGGGAKMVFTSGQIALDPKTSAMVAGDIAAQTHQVIANLRAVLGAAGASFAHVVKTTIYLADMADFAAVNEIYGKAFTAAPPARSTVQAAGLPKNARVEIDMVAVIG